jgi:hypothetical protein
MEIFNYYTLDECINRDTIIEKLDELLNDGKINYEIDGDILNIQDIDLEDREISEINELFEDMDVFPYLEREDDDDDDDFDNYYDEEGEDY